ncbi:MAG: PASTA domain-containing protein, partial [Aggregatilineales bacterium]
MKRYLFLLSIVLLCVSGAVFAQDNVSVPDMTGLSVPQAAALLNSNGLSLGTVTNVGWSEDSGLPQNSISEQSVAADSEATTGATVDVTRLQATNMTMVYDGNLVTFINRSGVVLDISNLMFRADNGSEFPALRWTNILAVGECGQIWSIQQGAPFELAECATTYWQSTQQTILHFWTGDSGATQFDVIQDGASRATCMAAPAGSGGGTPTTCDFYLPTAGVDIDDTAYIY